MLYAILCYNDEARVEAWSKEKDDAVLAKRRVVTDGLAAKGKLGPVARLMPTTAATTVRTGAEPLVTGGLLMQLGRVDEARRAFDRAIALAHTPAEAAHIRLHLDRLARESAKLG